MRYIKQYDSKESYEQDDLVLYNDKIYQALVNILEDSLPPDINVDFSLIQYSYLPVPMISSKKFVFVPNTVRTISIEGKNLFEETEYDFGPDITVEDVTINLNDTVDLVLSIGNASYTEYKKANIHNGISNCTNIEYIITDAIYGNGPSGTFITDFNNGGSGTDTWGNEWEFNCYKTDNDQSERRYLKTSNRGTPSNGTGPNSSVDGTYYFYIETSNPNNGNDCYGEFITDNFAKLISIEFDYFMYGSGIGGLYIEGYDNESWSIIYSLEGEQMTSGNDSWGHVTLQSEVYHKFSKIKFRFGPAKTYRGDIALDNIKIVSED